MNAFIHSFFFSFSFVQNNMYINLIAHEPGHVLIPFIGTVFENSVIRNLFYLFLKFFFMKITKLKFGLAAVAAILLSTANAQVNVGVANSTNAAVKATTSATAAKTAVQQTSAVTKTAATQAVNNVKATTTNATTNTINAAADTKVATDANAQ